MHSLSPALSIFFSPFESRSPFLVFFLDVSSFPPPASLSPSFHLTLSLSLLLPFCVSLIGVEKQKKRERACARKRASKRASKQESTSERAFDRAREGEREREREREKERGRERERERETHTHTHTQKERERERQREIGRKRELPLRATELEGEKEGGREGNNQQRRRCAKSPKTQQTRYHLPIPPCTP